MNPQDKCSSPPARHVEMREGRTARFNLPVRHPALWRFLLDQLLSPATRIHRYRNLSARMLEDTMREMGDGRCR